MGDGIAVECPICSTKRTLLRGVGMLYSSLEKILPLVQASQRKEIQGILQTHRVSETDYEHRIFFCEGCSRLSSHLYVKLHYGSGLIYETVFSCSKCGTNLREINGLEEIQRLDCFKCGKRSLRVTEEFLWD